MARSYTTNLGGIQRTFVPNMWVLGSISNEISPGSRTRCSRDYGVAVLHGKVLHTGIWEHLSLCVYHYDTKLDMIVSIRAIAN